MVVHLMKALLLVAESMQQLTSCSVKEFRRSGLWLEAFPKVVQWLLGCFWNASPQQELFGRPGRGCGQGAIAVALRLHWVTVPLHWGDPSHWPGQVAVRGAVRPSV